MNQPVVGVNSANAFWKLPDRIELDPTSRAEQFAAFLRARVPAKSAAPEAVATHFKGLAVGPIEKDLGASADSSDALPASRALPSRVSPEMTVSQKVDNTQPSSPEEPVDPQPAVRPFTPRYKEIPDSWKWPIGPYRQAPEAYGGEWWLVNPFTGPEPWQPVQAAEQPEADLPEGFVEIFGPRPEMTDFSSRRAFQMARTQWEQDLRYFQQSGIPHGFDQAQVDLATGVFEHWGLGRPLFYEGRYGWMARFPDSAIPDFEANAAATIELSHLIVAKFQTRQLLDGVTPPRVHPFVPPVLTGGENKDSTHVA